MTMDFHKTITKKSRATELIEQIAVPKSQQKSDAPDAEDLMNLLIEQDTEMKDLLKIAEEQEKVQKVMDELRGEVAKRDSEIRQLQRTFKEAEIIMATAVYQAKQKLSSIRKAQTNQVSSEDLIKYAHRISASNAVAAPPTWGPGDPRRPYPTDLEMRHSCLSMGNVPDSTPSTTPVAGSAPLSRFYSQEAQPLAHSHHHQQQQSQQPSGTSGHHLFPPPAPSQQQQQGIGPSLSWQSSQEGGLSSLSGIGPHAISDSRAHGKDEDIELMSSDSSSSSSSDE